MCAECDERERQANVEAERAAGVNGCARTWGMAEACLANWMLAHGFATGHGENFDALLSELEWQITELRARCHFEAATESLPPPESSGDEWSKFGF